LTQSKYDGEISLIDALYRFNLQ